MGICGHARLFSHCIILKKSFDHCSSLVSRLEVLAQNLIAEHRLLGFWSFPEVVSSDSEDATVVWLGFSSESEKNAYLQDPRHVALLQSALSDFPDLLSWVTVVDFVGLPSDLHAALHAPASERSGLCKLQVFSERPKRAPSAALLPNVNNEGLSPEVLYISVALLRRRPWLSSPHCQTYVLNLNQMFQRLPLEEGHRDHHVKELSYGS